MSVWTVTVSDPLNGTVLATVENGVHTGTGEVCIRSFDPPVVTPPGRGKSLNLFVKQTALQVPPRAIVQLALDEEPVFWGPVVTSPPITAPGAGPFDKDRDALERVTVLGGEKLCEDSVVRARVLDGPALEDLGSADVATIAHELCRLYAHAALTVDEANFPATGAVLKLFYKPEATLAAALDELAETVTGGADWWVDAEGAIHFEARPEGGS